MRQRCQGSCPLGLLKIYIEPLLPSVFRGYHLFAHTSSRPPSLLVGFFNRFGNQSAQHFVVLDSDDKVR